MKRSLSLFACVAIAACSLLSACADQPLTVQQKIAAAQDAVAIACQTTAVLVATGTIQGRDADNIGLGCTVAPQVLSDLQAVIPPTAAAAPVVAPPPAAASAPATSASAPTS